MPWKITVPGQEASCFSPSCPRRSRRVLVATSCWLRTSPHYCLARLDAELSRPNWGIIRLALGHAPRIRGPGLQGFRTEWMTVTPTSRNRPFGSLMAAFPLGTGPGGSRFIATLRGRAALSGLPVAALPRCRGSRHWSISEGQPAWSTARCPHSSETSNFLCSGGQPTNMISFKFVLCHSRQPSLPPPAPSAQSFLASEVRHRKCLHAP